MRTFFVEPDEICKTETTIVGTDARHIRKVLRLKPGAQIRITDGQGQLANARITNIEREGVRIEIMPSYAHRATQFQEMVVAQAMLKDRKMDGLVRALTELGMTTWMPFVSARSVAQPKRQRLMVRQERWARIAREAVKQCGRKRQPQIQIAQELNDILHAAQDYDHKIMFWEEADALPSKPHAARPPDGKGSVMLIVGPEGGFSANEAEEARRAGFQLCSLGPRILRAETAAIAALTLAQYLWGDWQCSPSP